jgi:hypothetical protein
MNAAEVVVRKMKIHGSPKILQFPRKTVRQSRESAKLHSDGQVLALHKTGGNVLRIGTSAANLGYNLRDRSWGVAFIPMLAVIAVEFRKLCEVGISTERFLNSFAADSLHRWRVVCGTRSTVILSSGMAVSVEMHHTGDAGSQREVAAVIEHKLK